MCVNLLRLPFLVRHSGESRNPGGEGRTDGYRGSLKFSRISRLLRRFTPRNDGKVECHCEGASSKQSQPKRKSFVSSALMGILRYF